MFQRHVDLGAMAISATRHARNNRPRIVDSPALYGTQPDTTSEQIVRMVARVSTHQQKIIYPRRPPLTNRLFAERLVRA